MLCPCKSNKSYTLCCKPFHDSKALASTPIELMRSRYSAYALAKISYLLQTDCNATQKDFHEIETFSKAVEWIGLEIIKAYENIVEFKAYYKAGGELRVLHERSNFIQKDNKWLYCGGEIFNTKIERNAPCPCGSSKKLKKCCL